MQGKLDPHFKGWLDHIRKSKEQAMKSGFWGLFHALCRLHEIEMQNYLKWHGL